MDKSVVEGLYRILRRRRRTPATHPDAGDSPPASHHRPQLRPTGRRRPLFLSLPLSLLFSLSSPLSSPFS
ncbi:hypothetical protein TIFTF001_020477, partial [Ficus carica]